MKGKLTHHLLAAVLGIAFTAELQAQNCVECQGSDGAYVEFTVTATNNCTTNSALAVTCDPPSGSFFPLGDTVVVCSAVDRGGDSNGCSFVVTVNALPPVFADCPSNLLAWALNADSTDVSFRAVRHEFAG